MTRSIPNGDGGTLGQPPARTLQAGVDLPHLHGSLKPHHFKELVTEVCRVRQQKQHICISLFLRLAQARRSGP